MFLIFPGMEISSHKITNFFIYQEQTRKARKRNKQKKSALKKFPILLRKKFFSHFVMAAD